MTPHEEVQKYQDLLKLGRALDEESFLDLMNNYEIRDEGECGSFVFKGVTKAEFEELDKKRKKLKRKVEFFKSELTKEYELKRDL